MKRLSYPRFLARAAMTLLAVFCFLGARAQTTVEIGNPQSTTTEHRFPVCMYYNHSLTQQIYTADEIGMAGTISSIAFEYTYSNSFSMEGVQMYMMNVDKESFESFTDMVALGAATKVWEGTFTASGAGWVTIDLDTPFAYDGTSNLLLCCYYPNETNVHYPGSDFKFRTTATEAYLGIAYFHDSYVPSLEDVSTYSGTKSYYKYRNNIQLNITPGSGPTCDRPEALETSNVTTTGVTLTWTGGSGTYNVEYKKASDTEWMPAATGTTALTINLTNLTPGTNYQARVQSVCDDNTSGWKTVNFSTECGAITTFPWSEDFESYASGNFSHPCWVNEHISGEGTYIFKISTSSNGNSTHQLQLPDQSGGTLTKLVLPEMTLNDSYQFVLDVYRSSSTYNDQYASEGIRVFVSANGEIEGATEIGFIPRHFEVSSSIIPAEAAAGWYTYELPIPMTGTCHIILRGESQYCTATYMDNFVVELSSSCRRPTGLVKSDVAAHGATISWTSDATAWQVCLNDDEDHPIDVTAKSYTLTGLTPETTYSVKVRTNCGGNSYSGWTNPVSFTTTVACTKPTNVVTSNIYGHGVTITWDEIDGAMYQCAMVKTDDYNPENINWCEPFEGNTQSWTNLDPETGYTFVLRKDCSAAEDGYSQIVTKTFTTTVACAAPTGLTVTLTPGNGTVATLSWTEIDGGATGWVLEYGTADDFAGATSVNVSGTPSVNLTGLTAETTYYARVKAVCGGEDGESQWSNISFEPTTKLVIGSGTATSSYLPTYTLYNNSFNQQIYTVGELGEAGIIESIDFYCTSAPSTSTRLIDIYMVSTDKSSFEGATDWITVTENDLVYSGSCLFTQGWNSFVFDTPFIYDGTHNVALIIDDNTGGFNGSNYFRVFNATAQTLRVYSDNTNYDPTAPSSYNGTVMDVKNQIRILKSAMSDCMKPTGLTANNVGPRSVELSWTENGEATAWVISYNGTTVDVTTDPSYTLTGLTPETEYTVKVRPDCDENLWSSEITFTTEVACPAPTNVTASNITNNSAVISWESEADNFNVRYAKKTTLFFEGFEDGIPANWTKIDADGDDNNWLALSEIPSVYEAYTDLSVWAHNGNDAASSPSYYNNPDGNSGTSLNSDHWLITPQINLDGTLRFFASSTYSDHDSYEVLLSTTGTETTDFTITLQAMKEAPSNGDDQAWEEVVVDLSNFVESGQQGYIAIHHVSEGMYFLVIDDFGIYGYDTWQTATVAGNTITINGLTPEADYEVQVQSDCGDEDGGSSWVSTTFTTLSDNAAPYELNVTELTSNSAKLNWTGAQSSFNVRYRKAAEGGETTEDFSGQTAVRYNATNGELPTGWYSYTTGTYAPRVSNASNYSFISALTDNYLLMTTTGTGQSTYAIMPQYSDITEVSFNYTFEATSACGNLEVGYVTDNTGYSTFTRVGEPIAPATGSHSYSLSSADIATINNNNGYIAFKYNSGSSTYYSAAIDDVVVTTQNTPAGAWNTDNTNVTSGLTINSLETNTTYEWQVQGIISSQLKDAVTTDWSAINKFTTLPSIELVNDDSGNAAGSKNSDVINTYNGQTVDVTLTDRILYKDENWNTICLPFDVTIAGSPLDGEGVTAKTLVGATVTESGDHISLNFGDTNLTELEAGVPYIIKWDKDVVNQEIQNPVFTGVTIKNSTEEERTVSPINEVKFIGYYDAKPITSADENIYYMTANNTLKHTGQDRMLKSLRAYFEFTVPSGSVREFTLNFGDGESSGIISIDSEQLESNWYTIDGKMLDKQPTRKGVYIKDGNKVVIK